MGKKLAVSAAALFVLGLNGCAAVNGLYTDSSTLKSDADLVKETSVITGDNIVSVSARGQAGGETFYTATAQDGKQYKCHFAGGGVMLGGMTGDHQCEVKK